MGYAAHATCPTCGASRGALKLGYEEAVRGREDEFPILARAAAGMEPAFSTAVEWLHGGAAYVNWTQIVRTPFGQTGSQAASKFYGGPDLDELEDEALTRHLATVEEILTYGTPVQGTQENQLKHTCGGVRYYLGRAPREDDTVKLRPLRDLVFLANRQAPDVDGVTHEWLGEFSLQVIPG